jgi:3'(2'), 5'-bisphosphate nucleotidase
MTLSAPEICYSEAANQLNSARYAANHRIKPQAEHTALSAPRHTTAAASDGFDFAVASEGLVDAAARAGACIMQHYGQGMEVELKADASPVTQADREAEAILLAALHRLFPTITVVSEEAASDRGTPLPARFFLVDPLDGTKEFINKRTDFTVNVALIEDGVPRFGLVYAPARRLLALTPKDGVAVEAELNPSPAGASLSALHCHPMQARVPAPKGLVAVVSHSHLDPATEAFLATLKIAQRSSAGSSLKLLTLARGQADVYPRFGPTMEWDIAAGHAVLAAAGGSVVDVDGKPLRYGKTQTGLLNPSFIAWGRRDAPSGRD